jgi:RNA polymerase sigma-70 factor (sigma-E family)
MPVGTSGRDAAREREFSAFVLARRSALVRTAALLTAGDMHLAEDLVQTSLTRLYLSWTSVRRRGNEEAYVRRILVNAYVDETRRARWRREEPQDVLPDRPDLLGQVDADLGEGPDGAAVRAALATLTPGERTVVVLRHWLDLSVQQTADHLGCSPGTVKSQNARGLARLRTALATAQVRA